MVEGTRIRSCDDDVEAPNKKRKVEEDAEVTLADIQPGIGERHQSLWFDEGNVIIVAHGKSFKVHSSVLSHHSNVFKELLSGPALAGLSEKLDNCPILRAEDRGDALAQLLQIVYDGAKRYEVLLLSSTSSFCSYLYCI